MDSQKRQEEFAPCVAEEAEPGKRRYVAKDGWGVDPEPLEPSYPPGGMPQLDDLDCGASKQTADFLP